MTPEPKGARGSAPRGGPPSPRGFCIDVASARLASTGEPPWERAHRAVIWLSILSALADGGFERTANPELAPRLSALPGLSGDVGVGLVAYLRSLVGVDALVKMAATAAYGGSERLDAEAREMGGALWDILANVDERLGARLHEALSEPTVELEGRVRLLLEGQSPLDDFSRLTGEPCRDRVVVSPTLLLPPPDAGRHGVHLREEDGPVALLFFGFPLREPLARYGITPLYVVSGYWHYAIRTYLHEAWRPAAEAIAASPALAEILAPVLGAASAEACAVALRRHVALAFRCLLSGKRGAPQEPFRMVAGAKGLVLFDWMLDWLARERTTGGLLREHLTLLPEALMAERASWERSAARSQAMPTDALNVALAASSRGPLLLVVPDAWPDAARVAVASAWSPLRSRVVGCSEWDGARVDLAGTAIGFGLPEENDLVREVLERRGLRLDAVEAKEPVLVALLPAEGRRESFRIAVAARGPEACAAIRLEDARKWTYSYAAFDGTTLLHGERAPSWELMKRTSVSPG